MNKKPTVILLVCFLIGLVIFGLLWIIIILMPFIEWAQVFAELGTTYEGPISYILEWLFLDVYFIGMIVCGILTIIFRIIARKSLKSIES